MSSSWLFGVVVWARSRDGSSLKDISIAVSRSMTWSPRAATSGVFTPFHWLLQDALLAASGLFDIVTLWALSVWFGQSGVVSTAGDMYSLMACVKEISSPDAPAGFALGPRPLDRVPVLLESQSEVPNCILDPAHMMSMMVCTAAVGFGR